MRKIQNQILPTDWLGSVLDFDIKTSSLSKNNQIIATRIMSYIKDEKEKSLTDNLVCRFVKHIIFKDTFLGTYYDGIPDKLLHESLDESKGERGLNFTRKVNSIFVELFAYQYFRKEGYVISKPERLEGSADLIMLKDGTEYNFEVKLKESIDIFKSRLFSYIDGQSLLAKNAFLRDKTFEIRLKVDAPNYEIQKDILEEVDSFIEKKNELREARLFLN